MRLENHCSSYIVSSLPPLILFPLALCSCSRKEGYTRLYPSTHSGGLGSSVQIRRYLLPVVEVGATLHSPPKTWTMRLPNLCKKVCVFSALFVVGGCVAQETSTSNSQSTHSATVPLYLVDVVTMDMKTALPATNLQKDDFELYDNGQRVAVEAFASSVQYKARPLGVWFALICDQVRFEKRGSGFIRGNTKFFRPALDKLDKDDRVGVAHWCDDGSSAIDMALTRDRQKPLDAIEVLMSAPQKMFEFTPGERAFKHMIHNDRGCISGARPPLACDHHGPR